MKTTNPLKMKTKNFFKKMIYSLLIPAMLLVSACQDNETVHPETEQPASGPYERVVDGAKNATFYGPTKPLGGGVVRAWVKVNKNGDPLELGVSLSEKAMTKLPEGNHHTGHLHFETVLDFPQVAEKSPFNFVTVDWNPMGHEPEHVYTFPHFDFHFYLIENEARMQIPGLPPTEFDPEPPAAQFIPADYIQGPGRIPAMGTHFIDVTTPELNGGTFTQTFLFGSYQHQVIFYEPMITLDYLLSKPQATIPVKQPAAFQQSGYYPKNYRIVYDEKRKEYQVYLADLTLQEAS
jgi:hypothetical protein